jgi:radical SAM protein with 4Fe4S-binding SPASM domain
VNEDFYFSLELHVTNICNLTCSYCYHVNHVDKNALTFSEHTKIIDEYLLLCSKWMVKPFLVIGGGEPFAYKKLTELLNYYSINSNNAEYSIVTNGTLIDEKHLEYLRDHNIRNIQISIDGYDSETHDSIRGKGTFKKIIEGIDKLKKNKIPISINVVLSKRNFNNLEKFFIFCKTTSLSRLTFTRMVPIGFGSNEINQILEPKELEDAFIKILNLNNKMGIETNTSDPLFKIIDPTKGYKYRIGITGLTIFEDGNILPTSRLPLILGNIRTTSLESVMVNSKLLNELRNEASHECENCCLFKECGGGNQEVAFSFYGSFNHTDPQCWKVKPKLELKNYNFELNKSILKTRYIHYTNTNVDQWFYKKN